MAHTLSLQELALGSHTLGFHVSPPLKACDLKQETSPLRASVSYSEMALMIGWSRVILCANWDGAQCLA